MTTKKKCCWPDCPRPANSQTFSCDLHDAIDMVTGAEELLSKARHALGRIARKDREEGQEYSAANLASRSYEIADTIRKSTQVPEED